MILVTLLLVIYLIVTNSDNYAVLVRGSKDYYNYRHSADIFHCYQILVNYGGYKRNNIIVMAYDDIAYNSENPYPGEIYNYPGSTENVYKGVHIDYKGDDVTPENFLNILKQNKTKLEYKVLESTENDNVFIYFSDHGGSGLIAFPTDYLYADDLNNALLYMHDNNYYNKLLFYLEACESGSMFSNLLPPNINIIGVTASSPYESSYAIFYNDTLETYMADEFSIGFLLDSENNFYKSESILDQFDNTVKFVNSSHPYIYGDLDFEKDIINNYQGNNSLHKLLSKKKINYDNLYLINSRDVKLKILELKYKKNKNYYNKFLLQKEINMRLLNDNLMKQLAKLFNENLDDIMKKKINKFDFNCLRYMIKSWEKGNKLNDYTLKYVKVFNYLCVKYEHL